MHCSPSISMACMGWVGEGVSGGGGRGREGARNVWGLPLEVFESSGFGNAISSNFGIVLNEVLRE